MGPRLISRGVATGATGSTVCIGLQWGRGSLAAAWLGILVVMRMRGGFNGAAAH